jgi:hypothetical protein
MMAGFDNAVCGGYAMRHVPARPEQTQSSTHDADTTARCDREALEQQRADLVRSLAVAEQSLKTFEPGSPQHDEARVCVTRLQNGLRLIRGRLGVAKKRHDLGELLIEVCRDYFAPGDWQRIVAEARRRHDAQDSLSAGGAARCE